MVRALAMLAIVLTMSSEARQAAVVTAQTLTVPADRLPAGCQLAPAPSERLDGNRVRSGLWGSPPLPSNPWTGTDALLAATMRQRVEGASELADGPPPGRVEYSRQFVRLAEGVEEAYAAYYKTTGAASVSVSAVRLAAAASTVSDFRPGRPRPLKIGAFLVAHSGDGGECHRAVAAHLAALIRP